jgi:hypothetical protein
LDERTDVIRKFDADSFFDYPALNLSVGFVQKPMSTEQEFPEASKRRLNWLLFFVAALAPVALTILTVLLTPKENEAAAVVGLVGGGIAGIMCGAMLGRRVGKTPEQKLALGVVFSIVMGVACICMSCFGCLASGYPLNL